jgi:amino acid transporter
LLNCHDKLYTPEPAAAAAAGFDAVATSAEEVKNPKRDLPLGILGALCIVTICYILMSLALVMMVPISALQEAGSFAAAFQYVGMDWARYIVALGALLGIITGVPGLGGGFKVHHHAKVSWAVHCNATSSSTPAETPHPMMDMHARLCVQGAAGKCILMKLLFVSSHCGTRALLSLIAFARGASVRFPVFICCKVS